MSFRDKLATAFIALMVPVSLSLWVPNGTWALPFGSGFRGSAIEPLRVSPVPASIPSAEPR